MNKDIFVQRLESMYGRITDLYQDANSSLVPPTELLPQAFKELGSAAEELQVALEELQLQNEQLAVAPVALAEERQRYLELVEFVPDGYLVTNADGIIQEANRAACNLLNVSPQFIEGKPLVSFIPYEDRQSFRSQLTKLSAQNRREDWSVRLLPRKSEPFDASLTVATSRDRDDNLISLRWLLRDITLTKRAAAALELKDYNYAADRSFHIYSKGEIIPLKQDSIWQVSQGIVRLSTVGEKGEEVLVGLAAPSMPFGSSMTSLQTYQATPLSHEVRLVCYSLKEIAASPRLAQTFLPQINQRLRQTESLLAVSGQRRVKDRLHYLLLFLKREIGQPVPNGTRLGVRLTHEEIAGACCTTRVTITRLLGKLEQKGSIAFDCDRHIILTEPGLS